MAEWKQVLWTDESKFEVFGNKRRVYVRRSAEEKMLTQCLVPTVKHGEGSVIVWGCFSQDGVGDLRKIDGIMRKEHYRGILETSAIPSGLRLIGDNFILMHDNDPKRTALLCRNYLEPKKAENVLRVMTWPPQRPDLNPIELLWDELDRKIRTVCPASKFHLCNIIEQEWNNIQKETIRKLIQRKTRIIKAVIKSKGGFFDEKKI